MKQKLSREVMRRKGLCDIVQGAVRIQGRRVSDSLGEVLTPLLQPEEALPDLELSFELYGRSLGLHCRQMEDADEAHRQQLTYFDDIRRRRGELTGRLKERFLSLRATCVGVLGEKSLPPLGLDFNLAQEPKAVLAQAGIVRDRLRQPDLELVPERWFTETIDPENLAQEFDDDVEALSRTLREAVDQQKKADMALVAKAKSIQDFDASFIPIAQTLEATFRVAGEVELADRIRPTIRRLTRPNEDDAPPPSEVSPPSEELAVVTAEESVEASAESPLPSESAAVSAGEGTSVETPISTA